MPEDPLQQANAQHMRAMGLDPSLLGQKFDVPHDAKPKEDVARCSSTNKDGEQCARRTGHDGIHARGYSRWDEDAVAVQLVEDAEPFTVPEGFTVSIPKINVKEVEHDGGPKEDPDAG